MTVKLSCRGNFLLTSQCLNHHSVLIIRLKSMPLMEGLHPREAAKEWQPQPALKVSVTTALSKKETEKAGIAVRHAITAVMKRTKGHRGTLARVP